jgi:hypothetical protein
MSLRLVGLMALLACGCQRTPRPAAEADRGEAPAPDDSLVASNARGFEVWFTLARTAKAPDGRQCIERGLEIRHGGTRVQVPLLYTGQTPVLLDDSTMRAVLWNHCGPVDSYLVDIRSGRPVREPARSRR